MNEMSKIPLYSQIEFFLRNKILSGQYKSGTKLPTKEELAIQFGVSKITVTNALSSLQREGLITSIRGKGTFVTKGVSSLKESIILTSMEDILRGAARYDVKSFKVKTVKMGEKHVPNDIQAFFGLGSDDNVQWIRRIRLLKRVPVWYLENFIPVKISQRFNLHLTEKILREMPLLEIIKMNTGLEISRGELFLEAVPAESDIAEVLQCQIFNPLIHMRVYFWFSTGEPIEAANAFLRGEYFQYKIDIRPHGF
jgi:DNA-binding GntR family transcriptional regulator